MNHRHIDYNWRATMGNAEKLSAEVAAYLDLVTSLVQEDGHYPHRTANLHTCAIDDPIVILHHVQREGLCSTPADHRLFDRAVAEVKLHRSQFFCDAEIDRRMKQADGACPMCGFELVFHTGDYGDGYQPQMTHCQHNLGHRVPAGEIDNYLRRPHSWQGRNWPYAWMQGHKITRADGSLLVAEMSGGRIPCLGCKEMEAHESMEQALFKLIESVKPGDFNKPGWSSPVSAYTCDWPPHVCTSHATHNPCDRVYMHVKRDVHGSRGGWGHSTEVRLNGAGLKLYIQPVRMPAFAGRDVTFGMRVGGDQLNDYPGFRDFAHKLFNELGVPTE